MKLNIYILAVLLLASFALAANSNIGTTDSTNPTYIFHFDNTSITGTNATESVNGRDGSLGGTYAWGCNNPYAGTCNIDFSNDDHHMIIPDEALIAGDFMFCFWYSPVQATAEEFILGEFDNVANDAIMIAIGSGHDPGTAYIWADNDGNNGNGNWQGNVDGYVFTLGKQSVCFDVMATKNNWTLYINGSWATNISMSGGVMPGGIFGAAHDMYFADSETGTKPLDATFDELIIWNLSHGAWLAEKHYTGSWDTPNSAPTTPTIIAPTMFQNFSTANVTIQVGSGDADSDPIQFYYFINGTGIFNGTSNTSYAPTADGDYNLSVYAWDGEDSSTNASVIFTIDTVVPVISVLSNNSYLPNNSTIISKLEQNLTLGLSFSDDRGLFEFSINITNSSGNQFVYYNNTHQGTTATFSILQDLLNFTPGTYTSRVQQADSHTKNKIEDYDYTLTSDTLEFYTAEGINLIIAAEDAKTAYTEKKTDRYSMEFSYSNSKNNRVFHVYSSSAIESIESTDYMGHLVSFNGKEGNWIDWEGEDVASVEVDKLSATHYKVTVQYTKEKNNVKHNSVGGLNIAYLDSEFEIVSLAIYVAEILPATPSTLDQLTGYCNGSSGQDNVTYQYYWFLDGVPYNNSYTYCQQDYFNLSYSCGAVAIDDGIEIIGTPNGEVSRGFDNDWNTYTFTSTEMNLTWNYTKPYGATNDSIYMYSLDGSNTITNYTFSSECWDAHDSKIMLKLAQDAGTYDNLYCINGSNVPVLIQSQVSPMRFVEDTMFWYPAYPISTDGTDNALLAVSNISNSLTSTNQNWSFSCRVAYKDTFSSWINSTSLIIEPLILDNCTSDAYAPSLNILFWNISDNSPVELNTEYVINYWDLADPLTTFNFSLGVNGISNETLCIFPNQSQIIANPRIFYTSGGTTFEYSGYQFNLTNTLQDLVIYTQDATTTITYTVKDTTDTPVPGAFIKVLRWDIANNSFSAVEVLQTNSDGEATGNIVANTVWYKFIIQVGGIERLTTDAQLITTSTKTFVIDLTSDDWFDNYDSVLGMSHTLTWTNTTQVFDFSFNDPNSLAVQGCLRIKETSVQGSSTIFDTCVTGATGAIQGDISGFDTDGKRYLAQGYITIGSIEYLVDTYELSFTTGREFFNLGNNDSIALYATMMLSLALMFLGIPLPSISIFLLLIGIIVSVSLGLFNLAPPLVISIIIIGIVFMVKQRK